MRNYYVPDKDMVDVGKMRAEAYDHSVGDSRNKPQDVVLHHHKYDESCAGREHENFPAKEQTDA